MRKLLDADHGVVDRAAADAGRAMLDDGGDCADGVIADAGKWLSAPPIVTFDRRAARLLGERGESAHKSA